ncbi:hypothetical protein [Ideonella livida]|uniref:Uncharacterized protein n=1 Tax=Ideonella livida TaxID=2707176 RepID=A0A7C9TJE1_9BURK|nr:hypothetical protein [Ideonella livida]NDY91940.1 hypothetical protein [Ideonella livida]
MSDNQKEMEINRQAENFAKDDVSHQEYKCFEDSLSAVGPRNLIDPSKHANLQEILIKKVSAAEPFSLIRLGDGEGNVLFWSKRQHDYPALASLGMERILGLMFGRLAPKINSWDEFAAPIVAAAREATFVGIPNKKQFTTAVDLLSKASTEKVDVRGMTGVAGVWDAVSAFGQEWIDDENRHFVNRYAHKFLAQWIDSVVKQCQRLNVITCYPDLLARMANSWGVKEGRSHLIPNQALNVGWKLTEIHYPDRYFSISEELESTDLRGELYLVGAGLLGKAYCRTIEKQGGMAIDVGSLMDVWQGIGVRKYQTEEFVEKYRL